MRLRVTMVECPGVNRLWRAIRIGAGVGVDPVLLGVRTERGGRDAPLRPRNTTGTHALCRATVNEAKCELSTSVFVSGLVRLWRVYARRALTDRVSILRSANEKEGGYQGDEGTRRSSMWISRAHEGSRRRAHTALWRHWPTPQAVSHNFVAIPKRSGAVEVA